MIVPVRWSHPDSDDQQWANSCGGKNPPATVLKVGSAMRDVDEPGRVSYRGPGGPEWADGTCWPPRPTAAPTGSKRSPTGSPTTSPSSRVITVPEITERMATKITAEVLMVGVRRRRMGWWRRCTVKEFRHVWMCGGQSERGAHGRREGSLSSAPPPSVNQCWSTAPTPQVKVSQTLIWGSLILMRSRSRVQRPSARLLLVFSITRARWACGTSRPHADSVHTVS